MHTVDKRVIDALNQMPTDPTERFYWFAFRDMITNLPLPLKHFYLGLKSTTTATITGMTYKCIYRLIAFLILKDLALPTYKGKSYDQHILTIFGEEYKDDIKECVRRYSQLHALEIEKAYKEFKLNIARDEILSGWFDSLIFDPEKVEEFVEECKAEWLTD